MTSTTPDSPHAHHDPTPQDPVQSETLQLSLALTWEGHAQHAQQIQNAFSAILGRSLQTGKLSIPLQITRHGEEPIWGYIIGLLHGALSPSYTIQDPHEKGVRDDPTYCKDSEGRCRAIHQHTLLYEGNSIEVTIGQTTSTLMVLLSYPTFGCNDASPSCPGYSVWL